MPWPCLRSYASLAGRATSPPKCGECSDSSSEAGIYFSSTPQLLRRMYFPSAHRIRNLPDPEIPGGTTNRCIIIQMNGAYICSAPGTKRRDIIRFTCRSAGCYLPCGCAKIGHFHSCCPSHVLNILLEIP
jgi:hypothetical protein